MHTLQRGRSLRWPRGNESSPTTAMTVLVTGGDGRRLSGHRRCPASPPCAATSTHRIVMYNQNVYWPSPTGQTSPTSRICMKTRACLRQTFDAPVTPISLQSIAARCNLVALGLQRRPKHLTELLKRAIQHKGFRLQSMSSSPCVNLHHDKQPSVVPAPESKNRG